MHLRRLEDPPFTARNTGPHLGGPLDKGRTFFFAAFEQRRRNESGFFTSDVQNNLTSSVTILGQTFRNISPQQAAYINQCWASGATAAPAFRMRFSLRAAAQPRLRIKSTRRVSRPRCADSDPAGRQSVRASCFQARRFRWHHQRRGQFIAFRPLNNLQRVFPVTSEQHSTRSAGPSDHVEVTSSAFRFGYNPSEITGIQVESQNQSLGQNDFSRTGIQTLKTSRQSPR
jgi:hypothetical protein